MQSKIIHQWLLDRGISDEVITRFGLTTYDHPTIGECLRIPITKGERGHTWAKYRRHPLDDRKPKYLYDTGGSVTLYGADQLIGVTDGPVVITEGELDTLVCWSQNLPAVSSTGGAMSFQAEWASAFVGHDVYVAFDNDKAGAEGMVKVLGYLPLARVVLIPQDTGVKDISDYVARGGNVRDLLATAKYYTDVAAVEDDRKKRQAMWQSTVFHDAYLEKHREQQQRVQRGPHPYTGNDKVLKAKSYPMDALIKFDKNKAICPWHDEKTPSLQYYPKTNSAYCFGECGRAYDSIDAYRLVHGKTFVEAVDELGGSVDSPPEKMV